MFTADGFAAFRTGRFGISGANRRDIVRAKLSEGEGDLVYSTKQNQTRCVLGNIDPPYSGSHKLKQAVKFKQSTNLISVILYCALQFTVFILTASRTVNLD